MLLAQALVVTPELAKLAQFGLRLWIDLCFPGHPRLLPELQAFVRAALP